MTTHEEKSEVITQNDTRLRILYLYQLLSEQSDENHPLTTNQIISKMQEQGLLNNPKEKVQTLSEIGQGLLFLSSSRLWITFCSKRI